MIAATDTLVGTVVDGRFEIRDKLGQGGMGAVYRAWQRSTEREIAIKLIAKHQVGEPMAVERFLREAKLASQLSHPNTISVYDFGKLADGRLFIAMELLRGKSLGIILRTEGALAFDRIVRIGIQICDALAAAHALKIVHRDLKPDNVMVIDNTADLTKVLDFGLAKRLDDRSLKGTAAGIVVGTPRYIAPEAMMTGASFPEGDVYALGVILAEMALGRPLWKGDNLAELCKLQMKPAEHIRDVPEPLHAIVASLLDPTPAMRPTAVQLRTQLVALQSGTLPRYRPSQPPPVMDTAPPTQRATPAAMNDTAPPTVPNSPAKLPETPPTQVRLPAGVRPPNMRESPWARPAGEHEPRARTPTARPAGEHAPRARTPSAQPQPVLPPAPAPAPATKSRRGLYIGIGGALVVGVVAVAVFAAGGDAVEKPRAPTTEMATPAPTATPTAAPPTPDPWSKPASPPADPTSPPAPGIGSAAIAAKSPTQPSVAKTAAATATGTSAPTAKTAATTTTNTNTNTTAPTTKPATTTTTTTTTPTISPRDCLAMRSEDDQYVCLRAYCKQKPSDPICEGEMRQGPLLDFVPKPAPKKTTPATTKKVDRDDVLDPFGSPKKSAPTKPSTTSKPTKTCDTCIERPD